jgi:pyruvate/2-oxoglutarate dehydrogenase complex dihydrolipoamide dehydrogenase (E3) component
VGKLLAATGHRPGWKASASKQSASVDQCLCASERLWAIGGVNGIWPLTHVGEYEADVVAANISGQVSPVNHEAVPLVT